MPLWKKSKQRQAVFDPGPSGRNLADRFEVSKKFQRLAFPPARARLVRARGA